MPNAEHSGDLGVATKEPRKGRLAAIGRVLLRLVKLLKNMILKLLQTNLISRDKEVAFSSS